MTEEELKAYEEAYDNFDPTSLEAVENEEEIEEEIEDDKIDDTISEIEDEEDIDEDIEEEAEDPENENDDNDTSDEEDIENENEDSKEEQKTTIRINGQDLELTQEELKRFAQKGGDYIQKTQSLAQYRNIIEFVEDKNLSIEDLTTLTDAMNGNSDALASIVKKANVDLFDINTDSTYTPSIESRNYELEDVINTIKADRDHNESMDRYISSVPETTKKLFIEKPEILQALYEDERQGRAQKIMPEVMKEFYMNPNTDFLEAYKIAGQKIYHNNAVESKEEVKAKPEAKRATKKKASLSKKNKSSLKSHKDVWEDDDLFEKMKKMANNL